MKKVLLFLLMAGCACVGNTQIVTPTIQGRFGIDADVQHNIFVTPPCSDCDDWFYPQVDNGNNSLFVIDTTGAAAIAAGYLANPAANANIPFYRKMRYPAFYQTNQRTLIDAVFVRDYHDFDQTAFGAGSNKNGDSPGLWTGGSGNMLQKNDILDTYLHLRRQGPNYNQTDSLWLFGAVAIEGTNGDRYFDFELYQTDIFYTRSTGKFTGYGPDAGHTSWKFDAAGNVTQAGDMIFAANYSSSKLTSIEARIWVDQALLNNPPANFDWTGTFDGASNNSQYGYAGIQAKNNVPFYFGYENTGAIWAGPFLMPRATGAVVTQYAKGQFMEFGINLTILGLDPVSLMGKTPCGIPFSKVMVKTRSSTSFNAELKDFISPFDFFLPPMVDVTADVPVFCGATGISNVSVVNPYSTSLYTWSTANGRIVTNDSTSITVDKPGTYVVLQTLETGCPTYAADSITIAYDPSCVTLASNKINLTGSLNNGLVNLDWTVTANNEIKYFTIERSTDGEHYTLVGAVKRGDSHSAYATYKANDGVFGLLASKVYYRIKVTGTNGEVTYSRVVELPLAVNNSMVTLAPNPSQHAFSINIASNTEKEVQVFIYDVTGKLVRTTNAHAQKGYSTIKISGLAPWARGMYTVKVLTGNSVFLQRILLTK
ncbi:MULTISPECIES: T9SS type A sorting domain-containing protein [Niastella]|uniref:T9SS type A sorting domain-containing protein n=1 Tax=Niastella soli TaxID=2821487 RepID=A0ABS3YW24_9BACT|nr:T9SS type A sorting domain-containing protein [Niastella soli]MBO9202127.1 T9SS type A sorting domain-containing protein [Niastella soli]